MGSTMRVHPFRMIIVSTAQIRPVPSRCAMTLAKSTPAPRLARIVRKGVALQKGNGASCPPKYRTESPWGAELEEGGSSMRREEMVSQMRAGARRLFWSTRTTRRGRAIHLQRRGGVWAHLACAKRYKPAKALSFKFQKRATLRAK